MVLSKTELFIDSDSETETKPQTELFIDSESDSESEEILRYYPKKKLFFKYHQRFNNEILQKINQMNEDKELQNDYKKWKSGKNYMTNRKITIGGKLHRKLGCKFIIHNSYSTEKLLKINTKLYLQETKKLNKPIQIKNNIIKDYNNNIDNIIEKINNLGSWYHFVIFEGKKYGLVDKTNIHNFFLQNHGLVDKNNINDNCYGNMILLNSKIEFTCHDRPFSNYSDSETKYLYYKCSKCDYEKTIVERHCGNCYESKSGFWWK